MRSGSESSTGDSEEEGILQRTGIYIYSRLGFDCEILLIANCEFFHNSQSKESQEKEYAITNYLPAWQFAIIKIAIWLVQRHSQSFNYTIKTRPTVYMCTEFPRSNSALK